MINQRISTAFLLFIVLFWMSFATYGNSIEHQKKFWSLNAISGPIKPDSRFLYFFEFQGRIRDIGPVVEAVIFRPFLGYQLNPTMSVWLSYAYFIFPSIISGRVYENRVTEQFIWDVYEHNNYRIFLRSRLEQRRFNISKQYGYRFRQNVKVIFPKLKFLAVRPVISDEVFFNLNRPDRQIQNAFNQNRFFIGIRFQASKRTHIQLGYMNQYVPTFDFNQDNHILYLVFSYYTG